MKNKKVILFDLDGTITDSASGIYNSIKYALEKLQINSISDDILQNFIDPSLKYSFGKHFFDNENDVLLAIKYYREYYSQKGMFENRLYNGIKDLLLELKKKEKILNIASSKPSIYVKRILNHFEINHFFDHIVGANKDGSHSDKADLIRKNMAFYPLLSNHEFVIIGDRNWDIIGAKEAEIDSIGVKYGFSKENELKEAGASLIVETVKELKEVLI